MMGREPNAKIVHIVYIGRPDEKHEVLLDRLNADGIITALARTQRAGLQLLSNLQPQVIVINTTNSHFSGDRLCRALGRRLPNAQRLLIVEQGMGLNVPCEERLARPFTVRKLHEALLRLLRVAAPHILRAGPMQLDLVARTVTGPRGQHHLTPKECNLLAVFFQHANQVISRKDLMARVWNTEYLGDTRTLDVHIRWLREKIEADPAHPVFLLTRRNVGYMLATWDLEASLEDAFDEPA